MCSHPRTTACRTDITGWRHQNTTTPEPITCRLQGGTTCRKTFNLHNLLMRKIRLSWKNVKPTHPPSYPWLQHDDFIVLFKHKERTEWNLCDVETERENLHTWFIV